MDNILSAFLGFLVASLFYLRAKRESNKQYEKQVEYLRASLREQEEARQRDHTIMVALERAKLIEAARDEKGNWTGGYVIRGRVNSQLEDVSAALVGTTSPPPEGHQSGG